MNKAYEIYVILSTSYWYVGSSYGKNPSAARRFREHITGNGRAPLLAEQIRISGSQAFSYKLMEIGVGDPIKAEQKWYDWYLANDPRETLNGRSPVKWGKWGEGRVFTLEHRRHISEALTGRPRSPEACARMSEIQKGRVHSKEQIDKMRTSKTGVKTGPRPQEVKDKISKAHIGKPKPAHVMAALNTRNAQCGDCELVSTPAGVSSHCRTRGHQRGVNVEV